MREYKSLRLLPKEFVKCPMDNTFEIMKKKYVFQIFREMYFAKQTRFSQFLESIDGINTKTLSLRLKEMEQSGLIQKRALGKSSSKIEYHISRDMEQESTFLGYVLLKFSSSLKVTFVHSRSDL